MGVVFMLTVLNFFFFSGWVDGFVLGEQPLSKIAIHRITLGLSNSTSITASPILLGSNVSIRFRLLLFFHSSIFSNRCAATSFLGFEYRARILNG